MVGLKYWIHEKSCGVGMDLNPRKAFTDIEIVVNYYQCERPTARKFKYFVGRLESYSQPFILSFFIVRSGVAIETPMNNWIWSSCSTCIGPNWGPEGIARDRCRYWFCRSYQHATDWYDWQSQNSWWFALSWVSWVTSRSYDPRFFIQPLGNSLLLSCYKPKHYVIPRIT